MKIRRDWTDRTGRLSTINLELLAESLKERIYASLALLAVLLTIDPKHSTALHAAVIIGGTALSLWLASLVSSQMARRMVFGQPDAKQFEEDRQRHSPLLASAILPLLLVGLSARRPPRLQQCVRRRECFTPHRVRPRRRRERGTARFAVARPQVRARLVAGATRRLAQKTGRWGHAAGAIFHMRARNV